jgi:NitT/TauT family transport system substrate-binding protein
LLEAYKAPVFPTAGVPTAEEWQDALSWLTEKGILTVDVSYEDSVNASLLP